MRAASVRIFSLQIFALCLVAIFFTLAGFGAAQSSATKHKKSGAHALPADAPRNGAPLRWQKFGFS